MHTKGDIMRTQIRNIIYDTEGPGVEKITEWGGFTLYRGKNGRWFHTNPLGQILPTTEQEAYYWLQSGCCHEALRKHFPPTEA
jgi:hypothetical protein